MTTIEVNHIPFKGHIPHERICSFHHEAVDFIIQMYSPTQKLALLGLTYNDLVSAISEYYDHYANQLTDLLKKKLIDQDYGEPFGLMSALDYLELDYKSTITFKRLLKFKKVPVAHIVSLLNHIAADYRIKQ